MCSLGFDFDAHGRLEWETNHAQLILVGVVTGERRMTKADAREAEYQEMYESTVSPQAILHGTAPEREIKLPYLGSLAPDCIGGPRLRPGEQVLLFLSKTRPSISRGKEPFWLVGLLAGKVLLTPDTAEFDSWGGQREPAGEPADVIGQVASLAGADAESTAAALSAIGIRTEPQESKRWLAVAVGFGLLGVLGGAIAIARLRASRATRHN